MGRQPQLARVQTDDANLNRVQDAVTQALGPVLDNPLFGAADFRFMETPGNPPTFALQYRTPGTTAWTTALTLTSAGQLVQPAWIAPALLNGWVNFGSNYQVPGYYKDSIGIVHLRGVVKSGTVGAAIFTLPAGYRPSAIQNYAVWAGGAGVVEVASDGTVKLIVGANTDCGLNGISFDTRN